MFTEKERRNFGKGLDKQIVINWKHESCHKVHFKSWHVLKLKDGKGGLTTACSLSTK